MISAIRTALETPEAKLRNWRMSMDSWLADQETRADRVALLRRYADGEHDADLTPEMQDMLRISTDGGMDRFNDNYMDLIIQTPADRATVDHFETDNDAANEWVRSMLDVNRFDALQDDVHVAALRDADTFGMAWWDNETRMVRLSHEPAYDGTKGMLVVLAPDNSVQIGVKVWHESRQSLGDTVMIAVYYDDRIVTYMAQSGGSLTQVSAKPFNPVMGQRLGQPVIHFPNRGTTASGYGKSEIEDAIPLQNALNRTLHSMVSTAELTGFPIRYTVGFDPGSGALTPGMWLKIAKGGLTGDEKIEIGTLDQGEIIPYIQQAEWLTTEMGRITRTPAPEFMGSSASSGEALKQREMGLLGKVKRFQVKVGNKWEDLIRLAWRVQAANGDTPPAFETIKCVWQDAEIRNQNDLITNAKTLHDMGYHEEALRQMATVFDWDENKIQDLLAQRRDQEAQTFSNLSGNNNRPTFQNFGGLRVANNGGTNQ